MKKETLTDTAMDLLAEADEQFAPGFAEIPEYREAFLQVCRDVQQLIDSSEASEFRMTIDDETMDIKVSFWCTCLEAVGEKEALLRAVRTATEFSCTWKGEETFEVKFVFPGIWGYAG